MTGISTGIRYPGSVSVRIIIALAFMTASCGLIAGIEDLRGDDVTAMDAAADAADPEDGGSSVVVPDPPLEAGCTSTGPVVARTALVSGGGNDWSNPQAARSEDEIPAVAVGSLPIAPTRLLSIFDFGFAVPATATIQGVKVLLRARARFAGTFRDTVVQLTRNDFGGGFGDNLADVKTFYGTDWGLRQYGSTTALWGAPLTPEVVNASDFGVVYQSRQNDAVLPFNLDHQVDAITMTVYYCTR